MRKAKKVIQKLNKNGVSQYKSKSSSNLIKDKAINRPKELQDLIFPGFDGLAIPNILTLKPVKG